MGYTLLVVAGFAGGALAAGLYGALVQSPQVFAQETFGLDAKPVPILTPAPQPATVEVTAPDFDRQAHSLTDPASIWVIVNKHYPTNPADYIPQATSGIGSLPGGSGDEMVSTAATALKSMFADAKSAGHRLTVSSAYRSYSVQRTLFNAYVRDWGSARAETFSARPGYSEHQTGLSLDIYTTAACKVKKCFAESSAYTWLKAHAHEYGFIERYPDGKQEITGYRYEPWHWRFVGVELATEMRRLGYLTLEEFFELEPAPDYLD